ncbi:MAG: 4-hydroxy-3-methylbut-2-en-yl diphosphate synthase [Haloplasmataceae bacterium]|jgi:(E)-4-hydroxy-3-methylbut-2-enyl-diphosphate synthase|nr:4-hydroxy-3-methylbut-2-en-yl diphosphate synthase [Haloplasmataceae bacterium]
MYKRTETRPIKVGNVTIGGHNSVVIQSMTNTKTKDVDATVKQINDLEKAGCQIVRLAVFDEEDAYAIKAIKERVNLPLVADIHFNYKYALIAVQSGIDKIRINPGNIGNEERIKEVVNACKLARIPIRIGVNSGSLEKHILEKYGHPTPEAMLESAEYHVNILEKYGFYDIALSLKSSDTNIAIEAYKLAAEKFKYPLHLGITEAGTSFAGAIKSSIGLGVLLYLGLGDTIRVSLSDDPVEEIKVCKEILKNFGLIQNVPTLISCPTCGRIQFDLIPIAKEIEQFLQDIHSNIKVAIMGCAVNGPGEAKEADIAIAGGKDMGMLIKKGEIVKRVKQEEMVEVLKEEILKMTTNQN